MDEIITQLKAFGIDFDKSGGAFAEKEGIRMNINAKNKEEVLGLLANVIQKRVKILTYFQNIKRDEK